MTVTSATSFLAPPTDIAIVMAAAAHPMPL
jgi:hypothetical protein